MDAPRIPLHPDPAKPAPQPATGPAMDIMPPKVAEAPRSSHTTPSAEVKEVHAKPPVVHHTESHHSGMGLIVFATITIVLGLGLLMVYAYLRTNGISIL